MSTTANSSNDPMRKKILWSSISRNDTILVEAGDDPFHGAVSETARGIMAKKYTAGWEYHTLKKNNVKQVETSETQMMIPKLKAVKFHLYERYSGDWGNVFDEDPIVWVFAAVYNPEATTWEDRVSILSDVKNFLHKIVGVTSVLRLSEPLWRLGDELACQESFAPTLLQRMDDVTNLGKLARLQHSLQETKSVMQTNITAILDREDQLREIEEQSGQLQDMASTFKKNTKGLRRRMMMQNAKHGAILGTLITTGVAICVIPPVLVAL